MLFAILDGSLDCLRNDQVCQLFAAARMHHITMLVLADTDPFDHQVRRLGADAQADAYLACIGEFTRVLRVAADAWEFCEFGYAAQRPAFESVEPVSFIWDAVQADVASREHQRRLSRRTSTLSQCSTTERRWLMNQESSAAATPGSSSAGAETLASRRQSRVMSPPLTARSSVSDFSASAAAATLDTSARMLTIDSALSKYAAAAASAAAASVATSGSSATAGAAGGNFGGPKTLKRRPLGGSHMFSAPMEQAEDTEQTSGGQPSEEQNQQSIGKAETTQEPTGRTIKAEEDKQIDDDGDDDDMLLASADTLTETSKTAINSVAAMNKSQLDAEPVCAPTPVTNRPYGERNPYARAPRSYKRSSRSSISSSSQRTPPPSALSNPLAAEVFVAPQVDQDDLVVVRRPFGRINNQEAAADAPAAEPVARRPSRSYSRSSPAPSSRQMLPQSRTGRSSTSRIPRPPTSSSVSTASSRSTAYSGSSATQAHVTTVDELTLALDNL
ncbi:hypothetical protein LPJ75_003259 [Coemansia sp. RSA 2598]|nr:hypothetical protein LPJ75_003259 [Coemansia sp. RSA 2598]